MKPPILSMRDYSKTLKRIKLTLDETGLLLSLGEISHAGSMHPFNKIVLGEGNPNRVLISAGIHGDEPAGVETICAFLERKKYLPYIRQWEFTLIPCINPFGFELGTRPNHEGKDLNRSFKMPNPPNEVALAQTVLQKSFDLTLELHEDEDQHGYYLYQTTIEPKAASLGHQVLKELDGIMPINRAMQIDGSKADGGVITRISDPNTMDWWPMALYALSRGARCCLTLETSPHFPMETRVQAHLRAIQAALKYFPVSING